MGGNSGSCNMAPSTHHAQQWTSGRRMAVSEVLHAKHAAKEARANHGRRTQTSSLPTSPDAFCSRYGATAVYTTTTNATGHTRGVGVELLGSDCAYFGDGDCDDGGPGAEFSSCQLGSDYLDCVNPPRGYSCQCPAGQMWDMNNENCVSMHWQNHAYDADTQAAADYFNTLETTLMAASVYIKPVDKFNDVLSQLQARECSLLYNSVNGFNFTDTTQVVDSPRNRFLRAWGMQATINVGAADQPCSGY